MCRKLIRILCGAGLVALGVVGLVLPVMPGWVFLIPGLVILADYYPPLHRALEWAKRKSGMGTRKAGR